jgi:hypothetical protein
MLLLCLIAALAGTPLRQAEAASDFARSQAERGQEHVETIDGGVGDDAEIAILKGGRDAASFSAVPLPLPPAAEDLLPSHLPFVPSPGFGPHPRPCPATLSPGSDRCHAWLQCLLF